MHVQELQHFAGVMKQVLPLRHPHLVGGQGAGKTGAYAWIARDYVEGESLARVIRRPAAEAPPDAELACRVGIHVGRALDFARRHHLRQFVAADGKLFFTNDDGETFVLRAGPEFELLRVNRLHARVLASPALVDGVWYFRTDKDLLAIAR